MKRRRSEPTEDYDVSEIECPLDKATVHGIVTDLSPIKSSRKNEQIKYFNAKLTDGKKTVRVVSFSPRLRDDLAKSHAKVSPIAFVGCQIKETQSQ